MLTDTETARDLVADLRTKLLYNSWRDPCLYLDWKEVSREIETLFSLSSSKGGANDRRR